MQEKRNISSAKFMTTLSARHTHLDKLYKHGLRKRSKFFTADGGRLYYVGGKGSEIPRLVVKSPEERRRIISSIHDQAHLGRDKTSEITARYYWPEMYNEVCSYVSLPIKYNVN